MADKCKVPPKIQKPVQKKKPQPPQKCHVETATERPLIEFPHFLRVMGPKHIKILLGFAPSAVIYGAASLFLTVYMCEWKTVLQFLPYYNGKYPAEEPVAKPKENQEIEPEAEDE